MSLSKEAQVFADTAPDRYEDIDYFPSFIKPIILDMIQNGYSDRAIAESLIDGLANGLNHIEPLPINMREIMIQTSIYCLISITRHAFNEAKTIGMDVSKTKIF